MTDRVEKDELMTPGEVARLFKVDPKTVTRWAHSGRLASITTPGGHKRFWKSLIYKLLEAGEVEATVSQEE